MSERNEENLLTRKQAADLLGCKEITLATWKSANRYGLHVVQVGRLAKYRYSDLIKFIDRRTVNRPDAANDK